MSLLGGAPRPSAKACKCCQREPAVIVAQQRDPSHLALVSFVPAGNGAAGLVVVCRECLLDANGAAARFATARRDAQKPPPPEPPPKRHA